MTCWRRLRSWQDTGVWDELHRVLLDRLRAMNKIDWSRAIADSASVRAVHGGQKLERTQPIAVRRAANTTSSRMHKGSPFRYLTEANRHDVTKLLPLLDAIPPIRGKIGRPKRKPQLVQADRGYDSQPHRDELSVRVIDSQIAKRLTEHGSGLGKNRWVVERTLAWLHQFRRLRVRYERLACIHEAFLKIGCTIICWRFLNAL